MEENSIENTENPADIIVNSENKEDNDPELDEKIEENCSEVDDTDDDLDFIPYKNARKIINSKPIFKKELIDMYWKLRERDWLSLKDARAEVLSISPHYIGSDSDAELDVEMHEMGKKMNDLDQDKTRLADLLFHSHSDFTAVEAAYKTLMTIWINHSSQKSDKKRESEAEELMLFIYHERQNRKELYNLVKSRYDQLVEKDNNLSRKITINQELMKFNQSLGLEHDSKDRYRNRSNNISARKPIPFQKKVTSWNDLV